VGMRRVTSPSCSDEPGELIVTDKSGDIYRVQHDGGEIDRNVGQSNFLERRCAAFVEEQVDKSWYRRAESADKATDHGENATVDHASPEAPALIVASPVLLLVVTGAAVLPCYRPTLGRVRNRKGPGAAK
jgi:hypothetical protein